MYQSLSLYQSTRNIICHPLAYKPWLFVVFFLPVIQSFGAPSAIAKDVKLERQRSLYLQVKPDLDSGSTRLFKQHQQELQDYPLYPYLEYTRLRHRLSLGEQPAIDEFLADHTDTWLGDKLRRSWLNVLYSKQLWQQYQRYYQASTANTETTCRFYFASYQSGNKQEAMEGAIELWKVGKSQPAGCDPLFKLLISEQRIDNDLAWQRYTRAVLNHEYQLALYVERFFTSDKYRKLAKNYLALDRKPARVGEYQLFEDQTPEILEVIEHAIRHLAKQNASLARKYWLHYLNTHTFDDDARARTLTALVKGLYRQGYPDTALDYLNEQADIAETSLLEWQLRKHLANADWKAVTRLTGNISNELRQEDRWRYWEARALLLHTMDIEDIDSAKNSLRELSRFRSFYGFLASDWVGKPYNMQDAPLAISHTEIQDLANSPTYQRIRELRHHKQDLQARREWYRTGLSYSTRQWQVAARVAQQWQWYGQAILAMTRAKYWNDIDVRFPVAYRKEFEHYAKQQGLPLPLILALARQESAFRAAVASPAGARGLMQLMPATAKEVARKHKIPYKSSSQLVDPDLNVHLGSLYYKGVLDRFNGNRILAAASYNAGPHRTQTWLKKSAGKLPIDAWVEIIPFNETRHYVQSVIAFAVIYAHILERDDAFMTDAERTGLL